MVEILIPKDFDWATEPHGWMVVLLRALVRVADPIVHVNLFETQPTPPRPNIPFSARLTELQKLTLSTSGRVNQLILTE